MTPRPKVTSPTLRHTSFPLGKITKDGVFVEQLEHARLARTGPMIVARDIAHAELKGRLDRGDGVPSI